MSRIPMRMLTYLENPVQMIAEMKATQVPPVTLFTLAMYQYTEDAACSGTVCTVPNSPTTQTQEPDSDETHTKEEVSAETQTPESAETQTEEPDSDETDQGPRL